MPVRKKPRPIGMPGLSIYAPDLINAGQTLPVVPGFPYERSPPNRKASRNAMIIVRQLSRLPEIPIEPIQSSYCIDESIGEKSVLLLSLFFSIVRHFTPDRIQRVRHFMPDSRQRTMYLMPDTSRCIDKLMQGAPIIS
jgi:hypothetical protein